MAKPKQHAYLVRLLVPSSEIIFRSSKRHPAKDKPVVLERIVLAKSLEDAAARAKAYAEESLYQWRVLGVAEIAGADREAWLRRGHAIIG